MSRYTVSRSARSDLKEIYRYIAQNDPNAAGRLQDLFYEKFRMLVRQPLIGEACDDLRPNLRFVVAGVYAVYYEPTKSGVRIVRVLHGARDVPAALDAD